jgi:hypothetical protein
MSKSDINIFEYKISVDKRFDDKFAIKDEGGYLGGK